MKAFLLVSHGSRSPKTKEEVVVLVNILRQRFLSAIVEFAFLEIEPPNIPEGIDICVSQGAEQVVLALNFLNSGRHVDQDIAGIVLAAQKKHPKVKFSVTQPIGQHPRIPDLFTDLMNNT